jgi:hypothetical protein
MAATFRSGSSGQGATGTGTSYATTLPTGWAAGDLVLVVLSVGTLLAAGFNALTGWTRSHAGDQNSGGGTHTTGIFYRVMQAGDTAPTFTSAGGGKWAWAAIAIQRGVNEILSIDVDTTPVITTVANTTLIAPSAATATGTDLSVLLYGCRESATSVTLINATAPTNWTEAADNGTATGTTAATRQVEACCDYRAGVTGTVTPAAGTLNVSSTQNAYHFLIKVTAASVFTARQPFMRTQAVRRSYFW